MPSILLFCCTYVKRYFLHTKPNNEEIDFIPAVDGQLIEF